MPFIPFEQGEEVIRPLRPVSRAGGYLNFPGAAEEQESLVRSCYDNFTCLRTIKRRDDPANVWLGNFNIRPVCDD